MKGKKRTFVFFFCYLVDKFHQLVFGVQLKDVLLRHCCVIRFNHIQFFQTFKILIIMRIVQSFLTVVFFALVTQYATASNLPSNIKPVGTQIQSLLKGIEYEKFVSKETKINITFFVNGQNEIIVVSTNNQNLDEILKSTLNYKKLSMNELEYNKIYTIPVLIK